MEVPLGLEDPAVFDQVDFSFGLSRSTQYVENPNLTNIVISIVDRKPRYLNITVLRLNRTKYLFFLDSSLTAGPNQNSNSTLKSIRYSLLKEIFNRPEPDGLVQRTLHLLLQMHARRWSEVDYLVCIFILINT